MEKHAYVRHKNWRQMLKKATQPLTSYFHGTFKPKLSLTFDILFLPDLQPCYGLQLVTVANLHFQLS